MKTKKHKVLIEVREHDPKTLRLREQLGKGEIGGVPFEISLCMTRGTLYLMSKDFQYSVGFTDVCSAILEQLREGVAGKSKA